jgi:membrane protease YdiL (CAAX protease family)
VTVDKLIDWIRRHQVVAFFAITFAITWGLGFSYGAVLKRGQFLLAPLFFLATCGPALAGIILTAVANTEPRQGTRKALWTVFLVAWGLSALVFLANNTFINHAPFSPVMVGFALVSVLPVVFVISMAYSRIPAVRRYLASLIRLRGVWGWALLGLVLFPALHLISWLVNSLLSRQPAPSHQFPRIGLALVGLVIVKLVYQLFFFNATGEEVGWRGFALPRLQARTCPLVAALVIAFFWAPWHFFLWRAEGSPVSTFRFWTQQYAVHILASLLIVWIWNRAHGSILVAGITHAAANTVMAFIPLRDMQGLYLTWTAAALVVILVDRMWKKLPPDHPAVYGSPEPANQTPVEPTPAPVL